MVKILDLSQLSPSDLSSLDFMPIVDVSDGSQSYSGTTKKILRGDIFWKPFNTQKYIGVGGATGGPDGSGILFPATADLSTDPNMLDDYEEGTWTPTYAGATTPGTATYTNQKGDYTRIGDICYITLWLDWSGGTGTGNGRITGLPFTANANNYSNFSIGWTINYAIGTANTILKNYVNVNTTNIELYRELVAGGAAGAANYDAAANLQMSGFYLLA